MKLLHKYANELTTPGLAYSGAGIYEDDALTEYWDEQRLLWDRLSDLPGWGSEWTIEDYLRLERDPKIASLLGLRSSAVVNRKCRVVPGGQSKVDLEAAKWVEQQFLGDEDNPQSGLLDLFSSQMLEYALLVGYSVAEVILDRDLNVSDVRVRNPLNFTFRRPAGKPRKNVATHYGHELRFLAANSPAEGIQLPSGKVFALSLGSRRSNPFGFPLGAKLWRLVLLKRDALRYWLEFVGKYGDPIGIGEVEDLDGRRSASEVRGLQQELMSFFEGIRRGGHGVKPQGTVISWESPVRDGSIEAYQGLMEYFDRAISETIIGNINTASPQGLSGSPAQNDENIRIEIAKRDADLLHAQINRGPIAYLCRLRFPKARPPQIWRDFTPEEDKDAILGRYEKLFQMGYRLKPEAVAEFYGDNFDDTQSQASEESDRPDPTRDDGFFGVEDTGSGDSPEEAEGQEEVEEEIEGVEGQNSESAASESSDPREDLSLRLDTPDEPGINLAESPTKEERLSAWLDAAIDWLSAPKGTAFPQNIEPKSTPSSPLVKSPKVLGQVRRFLEQFYFDGIDRIAAKSLPNGDVGGIFDDEGRVFAYRVLSGDVRYKLIKGRSLDFAARRRKRKPKCVKGISCGASCQEDDNICRISLSPEQKEIAANFRKAAAGGGATISSKQKAAIDETLSQIGRLNDLKTKKSRVKQLELTKRRLTRNYSPEEQAVLKEVFDILGLSKTGADPSSVKNSLGEIKKKLEAGVKDDSTSSKALPYLASLALKSPEISSSVELREIAEGVRKAAEASTTIRQYRDEVEGLKALASSLKTSPVADRDDYDDAFGEIDSRFSRLKDIVKKAQSIATGNAEVDAILNSISSVSRENLPGYKVSPPKTLDSLKEKSRSDKCNEV